MLTNVKNCHNRCPQVVQCGGHAWSRDGLSWSNQTTGGAFGPTVRFANGTYWRNAYAERPQVLLDEQGRPMTFYLGLGRTSCAD